jgi:hypothetical protein
MCVPFVSGFVRELDSANRVQLVVIVALSDASKTCFEGEVENCRELVPGENATLAPQIAISAYHPALHRSAGRAITCHLQRTDSRVA